MSRLSGVPCRHTTPVANDLWKPLIIRFKVEFGIKVMVGIKSDRWRVFIVYGQATECHLIFVIGELHIV